MGLVIATNLKATIRLAIKRLANAIAKRIIINHRVKRNAYPVDVTRLEVSDRVAIQRPASVVVASVLSVDLVQLVRILTRK